MRSKILAAIQQARATSQNLGQGEAGQSIVYLRQFVLVVRDVFVGRLHRDAPADVSRDGVKAAGCVDESAGAARIASERAWHISAFQLLGAKDFYQSGRVDCRRGDTRRRSISSDVDAHLSASPGLLHAAARKQC